MRQSQFKKGTIYVTVGSLWWGILGVFFFKYISFMGALEVTVHRLIWTCLILFISTIFFKKFHILKKILKQRKKVFILFLSSVLIFLNWGSNFHRLSTLSEMILAKSKRLTVGV